MIILICCCFLTGCWDKRELNEIAITVAFGIDKSDDGGFRVSAQIVVPSAISSTKGAEATPVLLFQADGETAYEAIRKMTKQVPRKIYPGHLKLLVIGEEMAREGIWDSLDIFVRDWELRPDFSVVVSKDRPASEILAVPTALDTIPANKLFEMLENSSDNWSAVQKISLHELLADISSEGKDAVLTGVMSTGDPGEASKEMMGEIRPAVRLYFDNLAVFEKDRLVGWLGAEQSKGFNYVSGNIKSTVETVSCPEGGNVAIEVTKSDSKIKASFNGESPEMEITVKNKGNVGSVQCGLDMKKPESLHTLESLFEKKLTGTIEETIKEAQSRRGSDIFGFGRTIHRSYPDKWKSLKSEWADHGFSDVPVKVKVEMDIQMTGTLLNPL
ncbi:Ger(x)C family spore germination protein [Bhargavaea ullalensis]|uniref:Spore germination protein KC n=1 Tax=Bhargavaea ullalensis TaxID=1265685 RepID=A0ABV2GCZ3_9BACL